MTVYSNLVNLIAGDQVMITLRSAVKGGFLSEEEYDKTFNLIFDQLIKSIPVVEKIVVERNGGYVDGHAQQVAEFCFWGSGGSINEL